MSKLALLCITLKEMYFPQINFLWPSGIQGSGRDRLLEGSRSGPTFSLSFRHLPAVSDEKHFLKTQPG